MIRLHYYPGTASLAPHILLREIGAAFDLVLVDLTRNAHKAPDYLALNPAGRIPTLADDDTVVFESAAICLHLADHHPEARLAPPPGSPERSRLYQWLMYLTNTVQADLLVHFFPERYTLLPPEAETVRAAAAHRLGEMFALLDRAVGDGPYLLGEGFTLVDAYLFMLCRWARNLPVAPRNFPNLDRLLSRLSDRASVETACQAEGLEAPWV